MKEKTTGIIEYLLEKGEIKIPYAILKTKTIKELNKAISSGILIRVSKFYERTAKEIDKHLNFDEIRKMLDLLSKKEELMGKAELSNEDLRILEFLVNISTFKFEDFLEIVGPIYNILKVAEELNKESLRSEYLAMFILTSAYVQLYELLLCQIDRRLYGHLKKRSATNKELKNFLKIRRDYSNHATAGEINRIISKILGIDERN